MANDGDDEISDANVASKKMRELKKEMAKQNCDVPTSMNLPLSNCFNSPCS